jgi:hypothetical protein
MESYAGVVMANSIFLTFLSAGGSAAEDMVIHRMEDTKRIKNRNGAIPKYLLFIFSPPQLELD